MKNLLKLFAILVTLTSLNLTAQVFSLTNTYVMTNTVSVVQTFDLGNMVPVVTSAGAPMTNSSRWGGWIPKYIDACIYTNGLTTNNVTDIRILWTAPQNKPTYQERYIWQSMPDTWDGKSYIRLPLAKERILINQRLHVLMTITDNTTSLTNLVNSTNIIYNASGLLYKIIVIPNSKPAWIP